MSVTVRINDDEVMDALDKLDPRGSKKALQKATKKGGNYLAQKARPEAPKRPRRMRTMTRARNAKRDKPGTVVSTRHKLSPIFQQGTVERFTKSGAYRGRIEANPFIARTGDRYGDEALDIAVSELDDLLEI
ncbi:MAG: hypothetical protein LC667_00900 [Thioalkalivibrio sp.]|nr:hypothetical protein [Thioalkalivibrio sp.]